MTTNDGIELCVVDDGIGFAAGERMGKRTWPPQHDERVRLAHGNVRVESLPGHGRKVLVRIPNHLQRHRSKQSSSLNEPAAWFIVKTHMNLVVDLDRNATSTDVTALPALGTQRGGHPSVTAPFSIRPG
jgi:hypothetical protein